MNAIIRHLESGEHFLATLDDSGDVVALSAPLPIADEFGRDWREADLTPEQWETFGYADVEPFDDEADRKFWTADRIAVVQEV